MTTSAIIDNVTSLMIINDMVTSVTLWRKSRAKAGGRVPGGGTRARGGRPCHGANGMALARGAGGLWWVKLWRSLAGVLVANVDARVYTQAQPASLWDPLWCLVAQNAEATAAERRGREHWRLVVQTEPQAPSCTEARATLKKATAASGREHCPS